MAIEHAISKQPIAYWQNLFEDLDACVEPVLTVSEAANSQLMKDRNMVVEVKSLSGKNVKQIAPAIKFSGLAEPKAMYVTGPNTMFTKQLLKSIDYQASDIEKLLTNSVVK